MERICHGFGANHLQKGLDSEPETLAPVGEHWLGQARLARPRALGMDPEEGVPCTGQGQGSKRGGWLWCIDRDAAIRVTFGHPVKGRSSPELSWLGLCILQDPFQPGNRLRMSGINQRGKGAMSEAVTPVRLSADVAALLQCSPYLMNYQYKGGEKR